MSMRSKVYPVKPVRFLFNWGEFHWGGILDFRSISFSLFLPGCLLLNSIVIRVSQKKKPILSKKEWALMFACPLVGQPRYPSLSGRRLCVPLFREVCLFHNYILYIIYIAILFYAKKNVKFIICFKA